MSHPNLSAEQLAWYQTACSLIDEDRLRRLNFEITAIHSPTGREREASRHMVRTMEAAGLDSWLHSMGALGNHPHRVAGWGSGLVPSDRKIL